jgi:uncharacterized protein (TIGR03083 family)
MTDTIENYHRALTAFDEIIGAVQPDQWANPTPCPDWTARDIAGHVTGGQQMSTPNQVEARTGPVLKAVRCWCG